MNHCNLSLRAGGVLPLAQPTLPASIRIELPLLPRRRSRRLPTRPRAQARDSAWYDDFYRRIVAASEASRDHACPRSLKDLGPWYYFMIPELRSVLRPTDKLLELGCGRGDMLRFLAGEGIVRQENIHGLDQSRAAVDRVKQFLPDANITAGDIYELKHPADTFPACLLMETIEHLEDPSAALQEIFRVIAPGGRLFLSFPNFLHLPWLAVRLLSDLLNKPNWIVRQPVDKIYTVFNVIRLARRAGFTFDKAIGSNYGPPVLYPFEKEWVTKGLNALGLWWLSFHPILVFRKPLAKTAAVSAPVRPAARPRRWPVLGARFAALRDRVIAGQRRFVRAAQASARTFAAAWKNLRQPRTEGLT